MVVGWALDRDVKNSYPIQLVFSKRNIFLLSRCPDMPPSRLAALAERALIALSLQNRKAVSFQLSRANLPTGPVGIWRRSTTDCDLRAIN